MTRRRTKDEYEEVVSIAYMTGFTVGYYDKNNKEIFRRGGIEKIRKILESVIEPPPMAELFKEISPTNEREIRLLEDAYLDIPDWITAEFARGYYAGLRD
jgi:hypothetical protein